ncbi:hypothetical protein, partial [Corynebacterium parakroppenstedtii]|uniref:hypothetical protein n=1 Tax=Corynebacterium parakroppenstedtii TaxID=2828363 RepID=UPI0030ECD6EF
MGWGNRHATLFEGHYLGPSLLYHRPIYQPECWFFFSTCPRVRMRHDRGFVVDDHRFSLVIRPPRSDAADVGAHENQCSRGLTEIELSRRGFATDMLTPVDSLPSLAEAQRLATGRGITVAVIDT